MKSNRLRNIQQPIQPLYTDDSKVHRFLENEIVSFLLNTSRFDMNDLARMPFALEDREQFLMLIGYSLSGFEELSYVRDSTIERARKEDAKTNQR